MSNTLRAQHSNNHFANHPARDSLSYDHSYAPVQKNAQIKAAQNFRYETLQQTTKKARGRILLFVFLLICAYLLIAGRLVMLTTNINFTLNPTQTQAISAQTELQTQNQTQRKQPLQPYSPTLTRANILDVRGEILATTVDKPSAFVNPQDITNPQEATQKILTVLPDLNPDILLAKLSHPTAQFQWIERGLEPLEIKQLNALGLPGIQFLNEPMRVYPYGQLFAHVLGNVDTDNNGISGLENSMNSTLNYVSEPVVTSLDVRMQHIIYDELSKQIERFEAKAGSAILMNANTGEVLAMVSLPTFQPTSIQLANQEQLFNRASKGVYELGSVFKLFTVANAIESGTVGMNETFDVTRPIRIGGATIDDYHRSNVPLTMEGILTESSNIGSVKIAERLGANSQREFLEKVGMMMPSNIELPEVGTPIIPDVWRKARLATVSYGHGISVSPLQLTTAVSSLVNGGIYHDATLLRQRSTSQRSSHRVISEQTSGIMRDYMEKVVLNGTGKNAFVQQYRIGGKTGTADKPSQGSYSESANLTTFVAAFPIENPKYVLTVVIDEPKPQDFSYGFATAGWVVAPVAKNIITRVASTLGLRPSASETMGTVDSTSFDLIDDLNAI